MISEFLISIRKLRIPNSIFDHQILQTKTWSFNENQNPYQNYTKLFEYSKNNE